MKIFKQKRTKMTCQDVNENLNKNVKCNKLWNEQNKVEILTKLNRNKKKKN